MSKPDEIFDQWLVLRCQGGDTDALAILVERWQPRLLGFAVRVLGERHAAEDAVQSAWVDIVRRIHSINDPKSIRPWLFRIVANKCADAIRKRSKDRQIDSPFEAGQMVDPGLERQQTASRQSDQVGRIRSEINKLDEGQRQVVRMHYLEKLSVEVIADRMSIPAGTVKSRLYHARQKLKQSLSGQYDE